MVSGNSKASGSNNLRDRRPVRMLPVARSTGPVLPSESIQSELHYPDHIRDLELKSNRASLPDYRSLVRGSVARIALFELLTPLSASEDTEQIAEKIFDLPSRCLEASTSFARAFDAARVEDVIGSPLFRFFPRCPAHEQLFRAWGRSGFFLSNHEVLHRGRDRKQRVFSTSIYSVINEAQIFKFWIVQEEISELREALNALSSQEAHYRNLVERPGFLLVRARPDGSYVYVSPFFTDDFGYPVEDFYRNGKLFSTLVHPEDRDKIGIIFDARERRSTQVVEAEFRVRVKDGTYHWYFERQTPKLDERGQVEFYDSITFDIQERKSLEIKLIHAQRMEIVGTLSGGIAHDFNNHLTAVMGQISLALTEVPSDSNLARYLRAAEQAALGCAEMTKGLLSFSRKGETKVTPLDAKEVVSRTVDLLRRVLPSSIRISSHFSPNLPRVLANQAQLQQILMNLAVNARDAMPEGGVLTLTVEQLRDADAAHFASSSSREFVAFSVSDSGSGIPEELRELIFEPFFTTKSVGKGTGLGLSSVLAIVQAHGGEIRVESEIDRGTIFQFILPASSDAPQKKSFITEQAAQAGAECVLVVDDDPLVLSVVTTALRLKGYEVIPTNDGKSAIQLFQEHREKIRLIVVDQTMPDMSGRSVIEWFNREAPTVRAILASGYRTDEHGTQLQEHLNCEFLAKPFSMSDLFSTVRSLLDA